MVPDERNGEQMRKASVALAGLALAVATVSALIFRWLGPPLVDTALVVVAASFVSLIALTGLGTRAPPSASAISFLSITALALIAMWSGNAYYLGEDMRFEPFAGNKAQALAIGLIAPPTIWLGIVAIVATGTLPLVQYLMLEPELRSRLPVQEPWITLIYGMIAGTVYLYRLRLYAAQRQSARAEANVSLLQDFAQLLVHAQHLANTPLQIIENSVGLLGARQPEERKLVATMREALARLRGVVRLFSHIDSYINWQRVELPTSPAEFERRLDELIGKAAGPESGVSPSRHETPPPFHARN